MSLGNSDKMSYGLTHCPHVDGLLISTGLLPRVSVLNNGVDNGVERGVRRTRGAMGIESRGSVARAIFFALLIYLESERTVRL
jgi:hypothetical protein